ncbi:MAG: 5-oxoprolinase/urea amidolyase family protein [Acidobacteria bacterium]|nr:5-oxoprolinase/urea amidolyase family protein [Acidobacteriota bacterium]
MPFVPAVRGIRPAGDRALLVELRDVSAVLNLHALLTKTPLPRQLDVIAAAETVLVSFSAGGNVAAAAAHIRTLPLDTVATHHGTHVEIDVVYDGADLPEVARLTGMSVEAVVAAHTSQVWTAAFIGFAPGFAYLSGETDALSVPRRSSPRTAVPAGSVALGGSYSAVYPQDSPGGWQLIGSTEARMWDLGRDQPPLARAGDTVQFRAVRAHTVARPPEPQEPAQYIHQPGLTVLNPGLHTTIQDAGRPGYAEWGVGAAGALDAAALRRANRVCGNASGQAGLEVLFGGLELCAQGDQILAVTGAAVELELELDEDVRLVEMDAAFMLRDGETLRLGRPSTGLRSYVAVRGGLAVTAVLGSRSMDTMSGIGPAPLAAGSQLPVGHCGSTSVVGSPEPSPPIQPECTELRVQVGPRDDWFSAATVAEFFAQDWTVTAQSNRIGLRLEGQPLERKRLGELVSEGTPYGAIQIPPQGQPVLFLADHPVTGGYPVIAVVLAQDLDKAAQLPPGHRVRFVRAEPSDGPSAQNAPAADTLN